MAFDGNVGFRWRSHGSFKPHRWLSKNWEPFYLLVGDVRFDLTGKKWYGITCYSTTRKGGVFSHWDDVEWWGDLQMKKKKAKDTSAAPAAHLAAMESPLFAKIHSLVAHCAATAYDDGDPRQVGWWTVKTMGSAWVVEVKDPDTCARLVVVQQTLDDALTLAALLLDSEEAPWEPDPWLMASKAKKKK